MRGRVLYFKNAKGHGRVLGADRVVYFVHFSMIRQLDSAQSNQDSWSSSRGSSRSSMAESVGSNEVMSLSETGATEPDTRAG